MRLAERRSKRYSIPVRPGLRRSAEKQEELPELRLQCVVGGRRCSKCCYGTEMPLTTEDIERIERLGYPREYFVETGIDGIPRLRNINGHCVFLDAVTGLCMIYPWRPEGCRLYPLVYEPCRGVTVDPECPLAHSVAKNVVEKLAPSVIKLIERIYRKSIDEIDAEAGCR